MKLLRKTFANNMLKDYSNFLYGCKINGYSQTFGLSYGPRKSLLSRTMLLTTRTESFKLEAPGSSS